MNNIIAFPTKNKELDELKAILDMQYLCKEQAEMALKLINELIESNEQLFRRLIQDEKDMEYLK